MPKNSSILDYFSRKNPKNILAFWKRHKIHRFLEDVLDTEHFLGFNLVKDWKTRFAPRQENFNKDWISDDYFIALFSFLKMLNENPQEMHDFFSKFLRDFFFSERLAARISAEVIYTCLSDNVYAFLHAPELCDHSKKRSLSQSLEEKKNPFLFTFEESNGMQMRINEVHGDIVKRGKLSPHYQYAHKTLSSLIYRGVRHEAPISMRKIFGYLLAGLCLLVVIAALGYLTLQTLGLIHLAWIIPGSILIGTAGGSALVGGLAFAASTPSVVNRFSSFFKCAEAQKEPLRLFETTHPAGMII